VTQRPTATGPGQVDEPPRTRGTPAGTVEVSLEEFSRLLQHLYEGASDAAAWRRFLRLLTERLRGNAAVLILRVPQLGEVPLKVTHGGIPERSDLYFRHFMAADPFVQLPEGRAVTMHDFVDATELERSEYFREWLEPMDMVYAIGVDMRDKGRYHVRLRLCRPRREGNFTAADCRFVETFVPHLRSAIHLFSELDAVRSERSIYAEAMDQLTLATIVLDENGRVLHANRIAESILAENDGITRAGDAVQLAHREDSRRFRELVTRALDAQRAGKPGLVEVMRVRRPSGRSDIGLVVRPSTSSVGTNDERLSASVAVFLSAESGGTAERDLPSDVIQKLFGLTPKEATLALRLAAGESLQEASESLSISPNTARAHLRSIFAKTGVDRQAKLVRVLLKSVAMLGQ
jgi:DNA-binding CsgD family transcriptional regulator/PAS domain-containing protein